MSVIHAPKRPDLDGRQITVMAVMGAVLLALFLRLWYVQVADADSYRVLAEKYRWSSVDKLAPRGLILDRKDRLLAGVHSEIVVTAIPSEVEKQPWVLHKVAAMLGADPKRIKDKIADGGMRPFLPTPIHVGASMEIATRIAEAGPYLPGIGVEMLPMRYYPNSRDFAHLLGYVWTPDARDVARFDRHGWSLPQYVGKQGLEWWCEGDLMGKPGSETIEVDARRRPVRVVQRENADPGDRLVLTLDRDLQKYANSVLASIHERFPKSGAAMAAIDPKTGEVLALASFPTYDVGLFKGGISRDELKALQDDPLTPMFDRAVSGAYSPGSTFKIATALAAAQKGYFDPNRRVMCRGYYEVGNRKIKCLGHHGAIAFREALAKSCNAYFGDLATHVGRDGLNAAAIAYGLGYPTGIELRGESGGSLPTDKWMRKIEERTGRKVDWYLGNTVNVGIGQGEVGATVLQMANAIAAVANGGVNYRPHLVKARLVDGKLTEVTPEIAHRIEVNASFWPELQQGLIGVIDHGTAATAAHIPGLRWAGKTGSTEARGNALTHSWFIGYAPADDPKIAIAVVVEKAGHGSEVAAPLAKLIVGHYLKPQVAP